MVAGTGMQPYASILMVIGIAVGLAAAILALTHVVGPRRIGPTKHSAYESGMPVMADARRRFNVRFYIVAMLFLLFDVEVVILWPWAMVYYDAAAQGQAIAVGSDLVGKGFLAAGVSVFLLLLLVGFVYEWKRGVFQWD